MAGQVWSTNDLGGYMWSPNLSKKLRTALQPMTRFRQFCDAKEAFGVGKGEYFNWNAYSDVVTQGAALAETDVMPETNFTIAQKQLTVTEYGNSVPFTKKLDDLSEQPVTEIIHKVLKNDARKALDAAAHAQFDLSPLVACSTSDTAVTFTTNGTPSGVATHPFSKSHAKLIADELEERNVPTYDGQNYMGLFRPRAMRALKDDLEGIHQYTSEGWHVIMNGEKGRYEGIRFVTQTSIASEAYTNAISQGFVFGQDTVVEAVSIPEEIRGKIPTDYGRSKGIAWYALLGYGIVHSVAAQARIMRFDSAS